MVTVKSDFFISPNYSVKYYSSGPQFRCPDCQTKREVRTRLKCTLCRSSTCKNHSSNFCNDCVSDLFLGAVGLETLQNTTLTLSPRKCYDCQRRIKTTCHRCKKRSCSDDLQIIFFQFVTNVHLSKTFTAVSNSHFYENCKK